MCQGKEGGNPMPQAVRYFLVKKRHLDQAPEQERFPRKSSKTVTGQYLDGLASRIQIYSFSFLTFVSMQFLMVPFLQRCSSSAMEKPTKRLKEFIFQVYLT